MSKIQTNYFQLVIGLHLNNTLSGIVFATPLATQARHDTIEDIFLRKIFYISNVVAILNFCLHLTSSSNAFA